MLNGENGIGTCANGFSAAPPPGRSKPGGAPRTFSHKFVPAAAATPAEASIAASAAPGRRGSRTNGVSSRWWLAAGCSGGAADRSGGAAGRSPGTKEGRGAGGRGCRRGAECAAGAWAGARPDRKSGGNGNNAAGTWAGARPDKAGGDSAAGGAAVPTGEASAEGRPTLTGTSGGNGAAAEVPGTGTGGGVAMAWPGPWRAGPSSRSALGTAAGKQAAEIGASAGLGMLPGAGVGAAAGLGMLPGAEIGAAAGLGVLPGGKAPGCGLGTGGGTGVLKAWCCAAAPDKGGRGDEGKAWGDATGRETPEAGA